MTQLYVIEATAPPTRPWCAQNYGVRSQMNPVPGEVYPEPQTGHQVRRVICSRCGAHAAWKPVRLQHFTCQHCSHPNEVKEYVGGGPASEQPSAIRASQLVDGVAQLGIEGVPP